MQSFSQFGFKIEPYFTTTQLQYEALKTDLEIIGHLADKMPNGIGAILLTDKVHWLTTYTQNGEARIGVYNSKNQSLITDITYGYPPIQKDICEALVCRLENHVKMQQPMHHAAIESAWEKALQVNPPAQEIKQER